MKKILDIAKERIIVFDGAMGTSIQSFNLTSDDYKGKLGCNEYLNITKPEIIEKIHRYFLEAGCDIIETNTFGANSIVLAEYGLANEDYILNKKGAELAKKIANNFSTVDKPRFVAGSIGPGTKLPSLGHIGFDDLKKTFKRQINGLIDGGVDILVIETCQDLLQAKSAIIGACEIFQKKNIVIPMIVQVTIESNGTMLMGSDMLTAIVSLSGFPIDVLGINCAIGPKNMINHLEILANNWNGLISVLPNAGMPSIKDGKMSYDISPDEFAEYIKFFTKNIGVNIVGGCCGTTPAHIKAVVEKVQNIVPKIRKTSLKPSVSSLYSSVPLNIYPKPLIVGERLNANGSLQFREFLLTKNIDGMIHIAHTQEKEQSHILDVCVGYTGIDEKETMVNLIKKLNTDCNLPLMIDSTDVSVIEETLKTIAGKSIINSINLEDGGKKMQQILSLCKKYNAAVIALTIDEEGMAKTTKKKVAIANRIYEIATKQFGIDPSNIFFDTLTFTLGSGDNEYKDAAIQTMDAVKKIKELFPFSSTILGLSNISFGFKPDIRHRLNSVFLNYAIKYGLDAAILNPAKIIPLYKLPQNEIKLFENLIFNKIENDKDPLINLLSYFKEHEITNESIESENENISLEEKIKKGIIDGNKLDMKNLLMEGLKKYPAIDIINNILLEGMKQVGELFGSGNMQLPFVLQSAETMRMSVDILNPYIQKNGLNDTFKGSMILATVKGDVHDIGKNLVDIILTNNGFKIINIGIKQNIESILAAYQKNKTDAIGMSGLLVQSTLIMKENLEFLNNQNITPPVILGGAALTRKYVDEVLQPIYKGEIYYAKDAFDCLNILNTITKAKKASKCSC